MDYSKNAPEFAAQFEGYSPAAVHHEEDPPGIWTLGFGSTYWNGARIVEGMECTRDEALIQLGKGLESAAQCVNLSVHVALTQNEFDAATDLCYNIGCSRWLESTARARLNAGDYQGASSAFSMWDRAGGQVLAGLLKRRLAEEVLFSTPDSVQSAV